MFPVGFDVTNEKGFSWATVASARNNLTLSPTLKGWAFAYGGLIIATRA